MILIFKVFVYRSPIASVSPVSSTDTQTATTVEVDLELEHANDDQGKS